MGILKMKLVKKILNKLRPIHKSDFYYKITGKLRNLGLLLPFDHKLPIYQSQFKLYDKKLILLVDLVFKKRGGYCVDIGANVGDTAIAIRASSDIPLICIEGDLTFYKYLKKNTQELADVKLLNAFVGGENKNITASLIKNNGTGKIISGGELDSVIHFNTLSQISADLNIQPGEITFIKIDTDGFDFDIIIGNFDFIRKTNASLFFEYEINSEVSHQKALKTIEILSQANFQFMVYDNFGNFMTAIQSDFLKRFYELNAFIKSSNENGGGIFYADVFATNDLELFSEVYASESKVSFVDVK